jgi:hypothetical protein
MSYFKNFPKIFYTFGDGSESVLTQNITAYAEVLDEVKSAASFYQDYYIRDGERPDHVATVLYDNPELHWVFYLMNDKIRERGWPLKNSELATKILEDFPNITLIADDPELYNKFQVGQFVVGFTADPDEPTAAAKIIHRDLSLGQIIIEVFNGSFTNVTHVTSQTISGYETIDRVTVVNEYNAPHHYVNADGEWVDINPFEGPSEFDIPVTNAEHYIYENDAMRQIQVLRPANVNQVIKAFRDAVKSQ